MNGWERKELWRRQGLTFCVEVSHHLVELAGDDTDGPNRWCVYAYIYPLHPRFQKFDGNSMWQDATLDLPLHGGPTLLRWHRDNTGATTSVQVGADYHHIDDSRYTYYDTEEQALSVFWDANALYEFLEHEA